MPQYRRVDKVVLRYQGSAHFGTIKDFRPRSMLCRIHLDTPPSRGLIVERVLDEKTVLQCDNYCKPVSENQWLEGTNRYWHLLNIDYDPDYGWALMC